MQPRTKRRLKLSLCFLGGFAFLIGAAFFVLRLVFPTFPPGAVTGDPLPVRLVGVWPEETSDLCDAAGRRVREMLGCHRPGLRTGDRGGEPEWQRGFIFEMPRASGDVTFSLYTPVSWSGEPKRFAYDALPLWGGPGVKRFLVEADLPRTYSYCPFPQFPPAVKYLTRKLPLGKVDVTLVYWYGPRGQADFTFTGPFEAGKTYSAEGALAGTMAVSELYSGTKSGAVIRFTSDAKVRAHSHILVYDRQGRRYRADRGGATWGGHPTDLVCDFYGVFPREIAAVTVGEAARENVFHNVRVRYDDIPQYPPYLDEMARRLDLYGRTSTELDDYDFKSPEEAIKVIDIVRSRNILAATRAFSGYLAEGEFPNLSDEDRARLKSAFESWALADDPWIRLCGIEMGLALDYPAFFETAIDVLLDPDAVTRGEIASEIEEGGQRLSAANIARIREILAGDAEGRTVACLVTALSRCLPDAGPALVELAGRDDPRLWYTAFDIAQLFFEPLGPFKGWPRKLKVRRLIASGMNTSIVDVEADIVAEAKVVLAIIVTPEVEEVCSQYQFTELVDALAASAGHDEAIAVMEAYVRRLKDPDAATCTVTRMARYVNRWKGVNIAGLGADPERQSYFLSGRDVAAAFLRWRETGAVTGMPVASGRAKDTDLRVVWFDSRRPESGAIALWVSADVPEVIGRREVLAASDSILVWTITPETYYSSPSSGGPRRFRFDCGFDVPAPTAPGYTGDSAVWDFSLSDLPARREEPDGWTVVIEPALSTDSVLGGTKVFADWWAKYGAEAGTGIPMSPDGATISPRPQGQQ